MNNMNTAVSEYVAHSYFFNLSFCFSDTRFVVYFGKISMNDSPDLSRAQH